MNSRVLPIFALMIAIGIFFAYVNPVWTGSIAATKAAIAADDQALAAASEYNAQQNQLAAARDAINPSDLARLAVFLPDSVDNVGLILNLNTLAARAGISLSNIDVTANSADAAPPPGSAMAAPANPVGSADLSLSAIGTYAALQNFLQSVEKNERLLDVRNLVIKSSDTGVYTYQMSLRLYWLR